ncbi:MAG: 16S rRNA (adenine(1518)-N(6)/adenine(1519)-N(6))-dimethyltransferase RsmA [Erysipelotrichaceae bacterium]|nr:16S rRNA (adenine(1518)-N(6)/adenine(1519)-N(6))-dimethyltransferase RsmA [Erysipelotrichaceae bacterium]
MNDFNFKKSLGQNFLQDKNILENIVATANVSGNSLTIEIGAGSGNLTKEIAKVSKHVLCYEIDTRLENILDESLKDYNNIHIIFDDFLKRDIKEDIKNYEYDNLYLIANLPYYITTPIIEKIIESNLKFKKIVVMIQKEVGERFNAKPGMKEYNSLTVYLNYYFDLKKEFIVSRNCFIPKPNVDSIVISLVNKKDLLYLKDIDNFNKLLKDSFKFKRKTIRNNLKNYNLTIVEKVLNKYNFNLNTRAEDLPLIVFIDLSNNLA